MKITSVRPTIGKPNVICSQSLTMSLSEAKKQLLVKPKNMCFDSFTDFIMSCIKDVNGFYEWFDKKYKSKDFSICVKVGEGFYLDLTQIRNLYFKLSPKKSSLSRAVDFVRKYS